MFGRPLALTLTLGLASLASGCFLDGTAFQATGSGGGGAGEPAGGGGEGGTTHGTTSAGGSGGAATSNTTSDTGSTGTTSTTSSTTTGSTTSSTTTTTQQCTYDFDCPDPDPLDICREAACVNGACTEKHANEGVICGVASECYDYPTCQSGQCKAEPLAFGEPLLDFDTKDCQKPICDGDGNAISVDDDSQVPDSTACADKACSGGVVQITAKADGAGCFVGPFKCCSGHCCDSITCLGCID